MGGDTQDLGIRSGMEWALGKSSPHPYSHPPPHPHSHPSQGKALTGWHLSQPVPGCQRGCPPPTRHTSFSPPPAPADAAVHTLDLLLFSVLGSACSLAAWQEPAVSLWVPAWPLISIQSPGARVRPLTQGLDASQGQPESLHPTARGAQQLSVTPCPTVGCTQAKEEGRANPACWGELRLGGLA